MEKLKVGKKYLVRATDYGGMFSARDDTEKAKKPIPMRYVGMNGDNHLFVREAGFAESFTWWELERAMV